jgi:hypothetical protein
LAEREIGQGLSGILIADVVGCSQIMKANEINSSAERSCVTDLAH